MLAARCRCATGYHVAGATDDEVDRFHLDGTLAQSKGTSMKKWRRSFAGSSTSSRWRWFPGGRVADIERSRSSLIFRLARTWRTSPSCLPAERSSFATTSRDKTYSEDLSEEEKARITDSLNKAVATAAQDRASLG